MRDYRRFGKRLGQQIETEEMIWMIVGNEDRVQLRLVSNILAMSRCASARPSGTSTNSASRRPFTRV